MSRPDPRIPENGGLPRRRTSRRHWACLQRACRAGLACTRRRHDEATGRRVSFFAPARHRSAHDDRLVRRRRRSPHEYQEIARQPDRGPDARPGAWLSIADPHRAAVALVPATRGIGVRRKTIGLLGRLVPFTGVAAALLTALIAPPASRFQHRPRPLLLVARRAQALGLALPRLGSWRVRSSPSESRRCCAPCCSGAPRRRGARGGRVHAPHDRWLVPAANQRFR